MKTCTPFIILGLCLYCSAGIRGDNTHQTKSSAYNRQDRENISFDNPLKGFSKFLFFPMIPTGSKKSAEHLMKLVESKLQKYGQVNKSKILIQTDQGEVIDLSPFDVGATLIYQVEDLTTSRGKMLGIVRASLNFSTTITIAKTQEMCSPYIWAANFFALGSTKKHLDKFVEMSLNDLLDQFIRDFSAVNASLPCFDLQGAD